jgi:3-oxoacyl-(acyl-carrier-protein) synthase
MIDYNEELLTPTAFIQSTHNTVGAQIALLLQCHHYNNTFVHNGFSFESALLDAILLLKENGMQHVLAGGVDEITNTSFEILSRFGLYKKNIAADLYHNKDKGTIAGEGAFFFLLSNLASEKNMATLQAVDFFYQPENTNTVQQKIITFLSAQHLKTEDIDVVITGRNGDIKNDAVYDAVEPTVFAGKTVVSFKHLCGEYPTAGSFALWMAALMIKDGKLPQALSAQDTGNKKIKTVLVYNHYLNEHHSLFLLTAC